MAARVRSKRGITVVSLMLAASLLSLASGGCAAGEAASPQEGDSTGGVVDTGQPDSDGGLASLSTLWNVDGSGWYKSDKYPNLNPVFSEDGKYVVTSYPAVFDANTGDLLWEGQEADLQDLSPYDASFTAPQGTFEMYRDDAPIPRESLELTDAEEAEVVSQLGLGRLQADESVVALWDALTDARVPGMVYLCAEVLVSRPGERTAAKTGDRLCGIYDSTERRVLWASRVSTPVWPMLVQILSEESVLVNLVPPDGKLSQQRAMLLTADGAKPIDGISEAPKPHSFTWRGRSTAYNQGAGLGIDAAGRLLQFSMLLDGTTDVYLTDLSADGTKAIYWKRPSTGTTGWGVAEIR